MTVSRRFTVLLVALSVLCAGWLVQANTSAGETKPPREEKKKPKEGKEGKELKVDGEITDNDAKDSKKTDCYCKTYTYKMVKGAKYEITMRSSDIDSYLRLENSKGDQVAEDDDSGKGDTGLDAQIIYEANDTGDFKVIATTFAGGTTGKFSLTVKKIGGDEKEKDKAKALNVALKDGKGSVTGKLAEGDGKFKNKGVQKTYEVKLEEGKEYQIDLASAEFDAYLYLLDADGAVLAEDDDSGGGANGLDSQITFKATKSGTYRLVVTSYGGSEVGDFTLTVSKK